MNRSIVLLWKWIIVDPYLPWIMYHIDGRTSIRIVIILPMEWAMNRQRIRIIFYCFTQGDPVIGILCGDGFRDEFKLALWSGRIGTNGVDCIIGPLHGNMYTISQRIVIVVGQNMGIDVLNVYEACRLWISHDRQISRRGVNVCWMFTCMLLWTVSSLMESERYIRKDWTTHCCYEMNLHCRNLWGIYYTMKARMRHL